MRKFIIAVLLFILIFASTSLALDKINDPGIQDTANKTDSPYISVKLFGPTGTSDDSVTIQKGIDYCSANNKILWFPNDVVYRGRNLLLKSNLTIDSNGATIKTTNQKWVNGKLGYLFQGNTAGISNVRITNLVLDGNSSVLVRDTDIGTENGIRLMELWNANNITIDNVIFQNNIHVALHFYNVDTAYITNCKFLQTDCGIETQSNTCKNFYIENCVFDSHDYSEPISIYLDAGSAVADNIHIRGNLIQNKLSGNGILIGRDDIKTTDVYKNIFIENNVIRKCATGIYLIKGKRITVVDNDINAYRGLVIKKLCSDVNVHDNNFFGEIDDSISLSLQLGILCQGDNCTIIDNIFSNMLAKGGLGIKAYNTQTAALDATIQINAFTMDISGDSNLIKGNIARQDHLEYIYHTILVSGANNEIELLDYFRNPAFSKQLSADKTNIILGAYYNLKDNTYAYVDSTVCKNNFIKFTGRNPYVVNGLKDGVAKGAGSNKLWDMVNVTNLKINQTVPGGLYK